MSRTSIKLVKVIFLLLTIMICCNSKADTFGESCAALPTIDSTDYLKDNTVYGYVQKMLDMKTHVQDGCKAAGEQLKFCIKNRSGSSAVCTAVTMNIGDTKTLGSLTSNTDITGQLSLKNIKLTVEVIDNGVCLTMPTSRGMMPLICRDKQPTGVADAQVDEICRSMGKSCYDGRAKSQSLLSFSGLTINCLRDSLNKVFYVGNQCPAYDDDITFAVLRPFPEFQESLKMAVRGALILYVIIFGFKVIMNNEYWQLNKIAMFIVQVLFVAYFAVGLGAPTIQYGREVRHNGMTELALPILVEMTNNFTEFVFLAGGTQGLCNFDRSKYETGYEFYKVWDAVDCRIGYYLGMQIIYNMSPVIQSLIGTKGNESSGSTIDWGEKGDEGIEALEDSTNMTFFSVMFGFFMSGNIIIVIMGIMFVVVFISVLMYFMTAYLVCMVTLYVMAYISPIFIPMILFERTKGYFDSWLRIVISCTLQPAVIGGFIAMLLTMYDSALYGNCEFQRYDYSVGEQNFSTFELKLPPIEEEKCESSAGYKLMKYYLGQNWEKKIYILFEVVRVNDDLDISTSMLYVMLYVVIFYFFIKSVNEFASDLVGGPSVAAVTVNPNMVVDKVKNLASAAVAAAKAIVKAKSGDSQGAAEAASEAKEKATEDTSSNKREEGASDKMSTGKQGAGEGDAKGGGS